MKKIESKLFQNFEAKKLKNLSSCIGGMSAGTDGAIISKAEYTHATGAKSDTYDRETKEWKNL